MINNITKKELYFLKKLTNKTNIIKLSKPGRKIFNKKNLFNNIIIIKTSKGIISSIKAKAYNINGESLFLIK